MDIIPPPQPLYGLPVFTLQTTTLKMSLARAKGFVVVDGDKGIGKTSALLEWLDKDGVYVSVRDVGQKDRKEGNGGGALQCALIGQMGCKRLAALRPCAHAFKRLHGRPLLIILDNVTLEDVRDPLNRPMWDALAALTRYGVYRAANVVVCGDGAWAWQERRWIGAFPPHCHYMTLTSAYDIDLVQYLLQLIIPSTSRHAFTSETAEAFVGRFGCNFWEIKALVSFQSADVPQPIIRCRTRSRRYSYLDTFMSHANDALIDRFVGEIDAAHPYMIKRFKDSGDWVLGTVVDLCTHIPRRHIGLGYPLPRLLFPSPNWHLFQWFHLLQKRKAVFVHLVERGYLRLIGAKATWMDWISPFFGIPPSCVVRWADVGYEKVLPEFLYTLDM
ncbi:hypothetical protein BZG36_01478 [Bifiguratus adelaidae]|uniref:Uncharacterized protein n=1 Tax=Bifiguratus adelaidae TaxID=1938954 RepID=A0A261Y4V6_9FUNG|nr:hypothetical protein BZG36_01478 [Bifiguratus adelaidae]